MKRYTLGLLMAALALTACSEGDMELHGKMTTIQYLGKTCWVFQDDKHNYYEVITPSVDILKDGLRMSVRAFEVNSKTLCNLPTVIEIYEFRPDHSKDM